MPTGFTAHNIVLPGGRETKPGTRVLADTQIAQAALRTARIVCPVSPTNPPRVVDLGCCEGGYVVEFARAGYEVLGIEARSDSVARCNYVLSETGLHNLAFVQDDVRNLNDYGEFDVVLCLGLLYHLDNPVAFLRQLGKATKRLLVLQTHFAEAKRNRRYPLGALTSHEGVPGRWYWETRRKTLHKLIDRAGRRWYRQRPKSEWASPGAMEAIYEQFDALEDIATDPRGERDSSSMFIAVKADRTIEADRQF